MPAPPSPSLLRRLRLALWVLALAGLGYLALRFDNLTLPGGCSPLLRYAPGNRLLLDRRFRALEPGDAVLFRGGEQLLLGLVERVEDHPARRFWLVTDAPDCPGSASPELGWIPREDVVARIVLVWPF